MKSLVIYYSHYGHTTFITHKAWGELAKKGESEIFEVEYAGGKKNIITRFFYRAFPFLVKLKPIPCDLANYDVLFIGVPVLGAHPSSAILRYIESLKNINDKKIICCYVYGIELSAQHCLRKVNKILNKMGTPRIINIAISWSDVHGDNPATKTLSNAISGLG